MSTLDESDRGEAVGSPSGPDDRFLIESMSGGDEAALRKLMDRYDRLVRFTIFRTSKSHCTHDPQWLDAVATETWLGFVRAVRRRPDDPPRSVAALLTLIARRRAATASRSPASRLDSREGVEMDDAAAESSGAADPSEVLADLEQLQALRGCLSDLDEDDRTLVSQLGSITERRWVEAASALGMQESTLRSRWKRMLDSLRRCLKGKLEKESFAPAGDRRDK